MNQCLLMWNSWSKEMVYSLKGPFDSYVIMKQQWKFRGHRHFRWHSAIGTLRYKLGSSTFRYETNRTGSVLPFGVHGSLGLGGPVGNLALSASLNNVMYFICRCCDGLSYAPQTHLSLDSASAVALRCDGDVQHLIIHDWAVGEKRPWKSYPRPSLSSASQVK